jgi:hypothetical protein
MMKRLLGTLLLVGLMATPAMAAPPDKWSLRPFVSFIHFRNVSFCHVACVFANTVIVGVELSYGDGFRVDVGHSFETPESSTLGRIGMGMLNYIQITVFINP